MHRKFSKYGVFLVLVLLLLASASHALVSAENQSPAAAPSNPLGTTLQAYTPPGDPPVIDPQGVQQLEDGGAQVTIAPQTGGASFIRLKPAQSKTITESAAPTATVAGKAGAFWQAYGSVFGITRPDQELVTGQPERDATGAQHLTYQQVYQGLPVFGGEIKLHFDPSGQVTTANGLFVPAIDLPTQPNLTSDQANEIALAAFEQPEGSPVKTTLMIFRTGLAEGQPGQNYLAYEVEVSNPAGQRSFFYVDALKGKLLDTINGTETLNRSVYNGSISAGNLLWNEAMGPYSGGDPVVGNLADYAKDAYTLFWQLSGGTYQSFDNQDGQMVTVAHVVSSTFCPNASWNGSEISVCDGLAVPDVIAHEWSHAYTQYTDNLIYKWQPGALNEAYSDIFGETVDLLRNKNNPLYNTPRAVGICSGSAPGSPLRWLMGEYTVGFNGALRDMWSPTCKGDPGKVSDPQYYCSATDDGGVHTNSGVINHTFALLVDGGTYNNLTIDGIGLNKAAAIYWYAARHLQTPVTDFTAHAEALESACTALIGQPIYGLDLNSNIPVDSGERIDNVTCAQVHNATLATELRTSPKQCGFRPLLAQNAPALCSAPGAGSPASITSYNFETSSQGWTVQRDAYGNPTFTTPDWAIRSSGLPEGRAGSAFYAPNSTGDGGCSVDQTGVRKLISPEIVVPDSHVVNLAFDQSLSTEMDWDGGNLWIQVNGGAWQPILRSDFTYNAYNLPLMVTSGWFTSTNPLAGMDAFSGTDNGAVTSAWGQSQVSLMRFARAGDRIRLGFYLSQDNCTGGQGWYIDNVQLYSCSNQIINRVYLPTIEQ